MRQEYVGFLALAVLLVGGLLLARSLGTPGSTSSEPNLPRTVTFGSLMIENAWIAVPVGDQPRTAAYMTITNNSDIGERLVGAATPVAGMAHLHRTVTENSVSRMDGVDAVILPGSATFSLQPGGYHIMLMNLTGDLDEGDVVPITLEFLEMGDVTFDVEVKTRASMMGTGS